jgi:hypothetical protein
MYFNIDKIRGVTLNRIPADKPDMLADVKKFMRAENLLELKIFSNLYMFNSCLYIDKDSFNLFIDTLCKKFGMTNIVGSYHKCHVPDIEKSFIVESLSQFNEVENLRRQLSSESRKEHHKKRSVFNNPLPTDITDKKLLSIDFEFIPDGTHLDPVEMGISIQMNGKKVSFNYSFIHEHTNKFNYGETTYVDKFFILDIFKHHCAGCDYLIGHNLSSEIHILTSLGLDDSFFEAITLIDTACVSKNEFHFLNTDHVENDYASLKTSLRTFGIPYNRLHVAGNDAAYTLDLLECLISAKSNFKRKNDKQKIQIKSVYKK